MPVIISTQSRPIDAFVVEFDTGVPRQYTSPAEVEIEIHSARRRPQPGLGPGIGAQLASQCRAAMAGKAGKELCATMERRGRPEVGRALHWCSSMSPFPSVAPDCVVKTVVTEACFDRPPIPFRRLPDLPRSGRTALGRMC